MTLYKTSIFSHLYAFLPVFLHDYALKVNFEHIKVNYVQKLPYLFPNFAL